MAGLFGVIMMACAAVVAAAFAIDFFWRTGKRQAFVLSGVIIVVFLLFWASGIWEGASRHSWGVLAPVFALLLGAVWLSVKFLPPIVKFIYNKINKK